MGSLADDCDVVLRILGDAPTGGHSMAEIQDILTAKHGFNWSLTKVNEVLCAVMVHIKNEKVRRSRGKVTLYSLRSHSTS